MDRVSRNNFDLFEKIASIGNGDVLERLLDKLTIEGMFYLHVEQPN